MHRLGLQETKDFQRLLRTAAHGMTLVQVMKSLALADSTDLSSRPAGGRGTIATGNIFSEATREGNCLPVGGRGKGSAYIGQQRQDVVNWNDKGAPSYEKVCRYTEWWSEYMRTYY